MEDNEQICPKCRGLGAKTLRYPYWAEKREYECTLCRGTGRIGVTGTTETAEEVVVTASAGLQAAPSLVALDAAEQALVGLLTWRTADLLTGTATDEATLRLRDLADRLSDTINGTTKGTR